LSISYDVYEQLVEETADRGKYNAISVDTSDDQQLERIIRQRVIASVGPSDAERAWAAINPLMPDGTPAIKTMITNSLMRPRFLIDLCEASISNAINRGHDVVDDTDVEKALENHSIYLVRNFGYEIRDVSGISDRIFYEFLGLGTLLTEEEVFATIRKVTEVDPVKVVSLLIWYGFLGVPGRDHNHVFIHDINYDMRRLEAERVRAGFQTPCPRPEGNSNRCGS
jgi:hypothetical protein